MVLVRLGADAAGLDCPSEFCAAEGVLVRVKRENLE